MTKELQDLAWSCLPKEFKEEVKKEYQKGYVCETLAMLITLFGHHNLTSDAEGEEMLTVSRKQVLEIYQYNEDILSLDPTHSGAILLKSTFQELFGSKCLPDNVDTLADNVDSLEQKPADLNTDRPTCTDVCSSKIDGRRLRIAAQMIKAIMGSPEIVDRISSADPDSLLSGILHDALYITDALIAECMTPTNNN